MKQLPINRTNDLIEQQADEDLLIYDVKINKALCLNQTAATVYRACDGTTTFEELKTQSGLTDEIILLALDNLQKENLLESRENFLASFGDLSRRQIIRKVGLASMIMLPIVSSLVAPAAACASSGCVQAGGQVSYSATGPLGPNYSFNSCINAINAQCCSRSATRNSFEDRCLCTAVVPGTPLDNGVPVNCAGMYTCN